MSREIFNNRQAEEGKSLEKYEQLYMIVYYIKNKVNGKMYVGLTTMTLERRFSAHIHNTKRILRLGNMNSSIIGNAILKYGKENFELKTLQLCQSVEEMNAAEIYWIDFYNSVSPNGYNIKGGGGAKGKMAESTKEKLRAIVKTPEWRRKLSESRIGIKLSPNALQALKTGREAKWDDNRKNNNMGEGNSNSKFTANEVLEIRKLYKTGLYSQQQIADMFNSQQINISKIVTRSTWKNLPDQ